MKNTNLWNNINHFFPISLGEFSISIVFLFGLYITSLISYTIFHTLVELFGVIVSFAIFIVAWNARNFFDNHFLLFLGIAYVFIAIIDIAHTLTYQGMGLFSSIDPTANLATQLWIAARYIQAVSLLIAPIYLTRKIKIRQVCEFFLLIVIVVFVLIFYLKIFPTAYIDGVGLTLFKRISEYVISAILITASVLFFKKRKTLNKRVFYLVFTSIIFTVASELILTTYLGVYDFSNMLGHYLKLVAFLLLYKTIVETGLRNPLSYIFKSLEKNAEILRASELKFRTLVELSTSAIILTNGRGEIDLWNSSAEGIFGWSKDEIVGKSLDHIITKKKKLGEQIDFARKTEENNSNSSKFIEIQAKRKNGESLPIEISSLSYVSGNEQFIYYIIRDISTRKRIDREMQHKNKKLEKLVNDLKIVQLSMDNAFANIVITDENGLIMYANKSAEDMTGFNREEMIGKTPSLWGKQMPPSFYENFWKIIKADKKNFSGEIINKKKNGGLYTSEIRVAPVLDDNNEVKFFVALERDITEQKNIDKTKTEFISLAAHQLRTPLSTISIVTEMLLKDIVGNASKENKKYLKNIFSETKDMTAMIEIFLNVSRLEMGRFQTLEEPRNLYDVVENSIKHLLSIIKNKKIHFIKDYSKNLPVLNLDKNVMKIILENLLSNAIKYSKKDGKIILSIRERNNNIVIKVQDNGIGIPQKDHAKIFTKMFRAENTTKIKSEGSGLGLYLVKSLAEQCGYNVSFKSEENKGTSFWVSIPINIPKIHNS